MFSQLALSQLQELWWLLVALLGSLLLFLSFVQGGQTLLSTLAADEEQRAYLLELLERKKELPFTTLVLFGGAIFAAFPLFYATSFSGAYWLWLALLFTFILQAVSYEFRAKAGNLIGARGYELFLWLNGALGMLLLGLVVGSLFTGSTFILNERHQVTWLHPWRGLEAATSIFATSFGFLFIFLARILGALFFRNQARQAELARRCETAAFHNLLACLPFLLVVLGGLLTLPGYGPLTPGGPIVAIKHKYLANLLAMPLGGLGFLLAGLVLLVVGVLLAYRRQQGQSIFLAGPGVVLIGLAVFSTAGFNNTAFYPSPFDPASSLTIYNASSSRYTLSAMSYIALAIPLVIAYIAYTWRLMDQGNNKSREEEVEEG